MPENAEQEEIARVLRAGVKRIYTTLCAEDAQAAPVADDSFSRDIHQGREILFILRGDSSFMLADRVYPATPGTAFFLNQWEPHSYGYRSIDRDLLHLWIYFHRDHVSAHFIGVSRQGRFHLAGRDIPLPNDLFALLARRWREYAAKNDPSREAQKLFLYTPLNLLLEEFAIRNFDLGGDTRDRKHDITLFLQKYIESTNGRGCSLAHLENICGYSRYHLAHIFRARTGRAIGDYINEVRLQFVEAAFHAGLKQKEIAAELGFSSATTFWIWRRKHQTKDSGAPGEAPVFPSEADE